MSDAKEGLAAYLTVLWLFLVVLVYSIIKAYALPQNFPWHSYVSIFLAYFCSLGLMLIVPLDVSMTVLCRRNDSNGATYGHVNDTLTTMYTSFYIPATILGSYFMFMQEEYLRQGAFTVGGRIWGVIKAVGLQAIGGIAFMMILFAILVSQHVVTANGGAVLLALILLNNTMYLVFLMLFLGYGLVAFPMSLWQKSDLLGELKRSEHKAAARYKYLGDATIVMGKAVADVMKTNEATQRQLQEYSDPLIANAMKILVSECPKDFSSSTLGTVAADKKGRINLDTLAALRSRLYLTVSDYTMAKAKVEEASKSAYYHEDLMAALAREDGVRRIKWSFQDEGTEREYAWELTYKPVLYRLAALLTGSLSLFSYLGILGGMPDVNRHVSVYYHVVHSPESSSGGIVIFVLVTLCYAAYAAMWSIFQMKISGMMELLPGQKTWPNSLSVNARVCAGFVSPTVFFYLSWISENGTTTGKWTEGSHGELMLTAFAQFYQIQVIPVIGDRFNIIFPVIIYTISFLVATNSINRALVMLGMSSMQFGTEILSPEALKEGRRQLDRHKRLMERATRRASLKEKINRNSSGIAKLAAVEEIIPRSLLSRLLWWRKTDYDAAIDEVAAVEDLEEPEEVKPNVLRGWGERKDEKSRLSGGWNRRYLYVVEPGYLHFRREVEEERESEPTIDLREAHRLALVEEKSDKFGPRLLIEIGSSTVRLRFNSAEDAEIWRAGLEQWKKYAEEHPDLFGEAEQKEKEDEDHEQVWRPSKETTQNPMTLTVPPLELEEGDYGDEDSVGIHLQKLIPVSLGEEVSTKKPTLLRGLRSLLGRGKKSPAHDVLPSEPEDGTGGGTGTDLESPPRPGAAYDLVQTSSPFHKPSLSPLPPPPAVSILEQKPEVLEGWLEKKNKGGLGTVMKIGHSWNRRYFRILEKKGQLAYYSSDKEASVNPSESIDLRLVGEILAREPSNPQSTRFDIELDEGTLQLRTETAEDRDRWVNGLNEWKDYFLMNMS